ncbi:hypothetical protein LINPERPRIM_LOCUS4796, partial [Linum perenne]
GGDGGGAEGVAGGGAEGVAGGGDVVLVEGGEVGAGVDIALFSLSGRGRNRMLLFNIIIIIQIDEWREEGRKNWE